MSKPSEEIRDAVVLFIRSSLRTRGDSPIEVVERTPEIMVEIIDRVSAGRDEKLSTFSRADARRLLDEVAKWHLRETQS